MIIITISTRMPPSEKKKYQNATALNVQHICGTERERKRKETGIMKQKEQKQHKNTKGN